MKARTTIAPLSLMLLACSSSGETGDPPSAGGIGQEPPPAASPSMPAAPVAPATPPKPLSFTAVTFNTGTSGSFEHDGLPDDGYGSDEAETSAEFYGDGLAWRAVIDDTTAFLTSVSPDVVAFQEIFYTGDCPSIPSNKRGGFICQTWTAGQPTVAQMVVGAGYQVACNLGKPDKCIAVKQSFGSFVGCSSPLCLDGLAGAKVTDCGGGSRVGRGVVKLAGGGELTIVNIHGSSGMKAEDMACRKKQIEQVFVDLDGARAASGARNLVLGDFNTDPGRLANVDESAARINDFVGQGKAFRFVTDVGANATATYDASFFGPILSGFNIDHVMSDTLGGSCWAAGLGGHPKVTSIRYFDHRPIVCTLSEK